METMVNFVAYMWILGILMVLAAAAGGVVFFVIRRRDRHAEKTMADLRNSQTWDTESPGSFGPG